MRASRFGARRSCSDARRRSGDAVLGAFAGHSLASASPSAAAALGAGGGRVALARLSADDWPPFYVARRAAPLWHGLASDTAASRRDAPDR